MKHPLKGLIIMSLTCASLIGVAGTCSAAYELSSEVKDATPALLQAAQIGVLTYDNPKLQKLENKDAILVMSFGTTFKDSREKTIDATVKQIQAAHPDTKVVLSFTSHIIIDRIAAKEGLNIPTPEAALAQLRADGYTRIALTSLDVIPGMEYAYDTAVFNGYKENFKKMTLGTPLMYWMGQEGQRDDIEQSMQALSSQFPKTGKNEGILVMTHGTPHPSNAYYSVMQNRLDSMGMKNVLIYSVEGWPHLDTVIPQLKARGIKTVTLMPMMMVAGDHANNDMAGSEATSHKSVLEKNGFTVKTYLHGLGENTAIRQLFTDRANEAFTALEAQPKTDLAETPVATKKAGMGKHMKK